MRRQTFYEYFRNVITIKMEEQGVFDVDGVDYMNIETMLDEALLEKDVLQDTINGVVNSAADLVVTEIKQQVESYPLTSFDPQI